MMAKLSGSRFRWINEQLYTITSEEALKLIKEQPSLFDEYHKVSNHKFQVGSRTRLTCLLNNLRLDYLQETSMPPVDYSVQGTRKLLSSIWDAVKLNSVPMLRNSSSNTREYKKYKNLDVEIHSFDLKKTK
ncbi:putative methyltransferase family protein [Candida parapsilosis]|nr:putative methyltransferase family protein [Candida parapsilosis]